MGPYAKTILNAILAATVAYVAVIATGGTKAQAIAAAIAALLGNQAGLHQQTPSRFTSLK